MVKMEKSAREDILDALDEFGRKNVDDHSERVPILLEQYFRKIAITGETLFPWCKLKPLFVYKLDQVIWEFFKKPTDNIGTMGMELEKFQEMRTELLAAVHKFTGAPFTIQRLCELLTEPNRHYQRIDKFLRGIEKNVQVVSTVDPFGNKVVHESRQLLNGTDLDGYHSDKQSPDTTQLSPTPFLSPPGLNASPLQIVPNTSPVAASTTTMPFPESTQPSPEKARIQMTHPPEATSTAETTTSQSQPSLEVTSSGQASPTQSSPETTSSIQPATTQPNTEVNKPTAQPTIVWHQRLTPDESQIPKCADSNTDEFPSTTYSGSDIQSSASDVPVAEEETRTDSTGSINNKTEPPFTPQSDTIDAKDRSERQDSGDSTGFETSQNDRSNDLSTGDMDIPSQIQTLQDQISIDKTAAKPGPAGDLKRPPSPLNCSPPGENEPKRLRLDDDISESITKEPLETTKCELDNSHDQDKNNMETKHDMEELHSDNIEETPSSTKPAEPMETQDS